LVAATHITQSDIPETSLSINSGEKHTTGDILGCSVWVKHYLTLGSRHCIKIMFPYKHNGKVIYNRIE
jgi:hypothetical protein